MRIRAIVLAVCGAAFLGYAELHTDDTGVLVFMLLTGAFVLGILHPKNAWLWALILAESIPLAEIWHSGHSTIQSPGSAALLVLFVTTVALAGAYAGVLVRTTILSAVFDSHKNSA